MKTLRTSYLHAALYRGRKTVIEDTINFLRDRADQFDAVAFCGMSGALVAPSVADALDKHLIMVRKKDDGSRHSSYAVEGELTGRYLILDDFISMGTTVKYMLTEIAKATHNWKEKPKAVAIFVYNASNYDRHRYLPTGALVPENDPEWAPPIPVWRTEPNRRFDLVERLELGEAPTPTEEWVTQCVEAAAVGVYPVDETANAEQDSERVR